MCRNISGECSCTGGGGGDASSLQGATWASPLSIGITTPQTGNFTTSAISQLNAVNINMSSLSINQYVATDASKNLVSVAAPTGSVPAVASTLVLRDTNANVFANNVLLNTLLITTTGATTNLSASTPNQILMSGTLGQTLKFPNPGPSGYTVGTEFRVNNNCSAGVVTVKDNGNNTVGTVPYGGVGVVICSSIAGNGTWDFHCLTAAGSSWGSNELITPTRLTTTNPTNATSTVTGSIQTSGGAGIVGDVWIGGNLNVAGGITGVAISKMFWQLEATKEVGNVFNLQQIAAYSSTAPLYMYQYYQNTAAINDQWSHNFSMKAGSYSLNVLGYTSTNRGQINWYIDGVLQGITDFYANPGLANVIKTLAVTITTTGEHVIRGIMATKNVSSTDYYCTIVQFWLK